MLFPAPRWAQSTPLLPDRPTGTAAVIDTYRFRDPSIGMKHNRTQRVTSIPNREPFEQFAAARFVLLPREQSLADDLESGDAERPFDAQDQFAPQTGGPQRWAPKGTSSRADHSSNPGNQDCVTERKMR